MCISEKEECLEQEFRKNWISSFSELVTNNVFCVNKYYKNEYEFSFSNLVRLSKDSFNLTEKEYNEFVNKVNLLLESKHSLKIISSEKEAIRIKEIPKFDKIQ